MVEIPIRTTGNGQTAYVHQDEAVDLVVIPAVPSQDVYEYKFIPDSMLTQRDELPKLNIGEGSDVFFTGLFLPYPGYERNFPVVRFGRVALVTSEKVQWDKKLLDLYLIESASYGGNSGSPVFFYLGSDRNPGSLIVGSPLIKLAGVMMGSFNEVRPLQIIVQSSIPVSTVNMGIAAVTPAYKLHEVLMNEELTRSRDAIFKQ
jgi:hypothetical protein